MVLESGGRRRAVPVTQHMDNYTFAALALIVPAVPTMITFVASRRKANRSASRSSPMRPVPEAAVATDRARRQGLAQIRKCARRRDWELVLELAAGIDGYLAQQGYRADRVLVAEAAVLARIPAAPRFSSFSAEGRFIRCRAWAASRI